MNAPEYEGGLRFSDDHGVTEGGVAVRSKGSGVLLSLDWQTTHGGGHGSTRLDPAEARELAYALRAAADRVEERRPPSAVPIRQEGDAA